MSEQFGQNYEIISVRDFSQTKQLQRCIIDFRRADILASEIQQYIKNHKKLRCEVTIGVELVSLDFINEKNHLTKSVFLTWPMAASIATHHKDLWEKLVSMS